MVSMGTQNLDCRRAPLEMLGYYRTGESHVHGAPSVLADNSRARPRSNRSRAVRPSLDRASCSSSSRCISPRAPNVPPTTVNRGCWRSVAVTADGDRRFTEKHETAGQRVSDAM